MADVKKMQAGDRYFMASVDLLTAQKRIEHILNGLREHKLPPSVELMAACIENLTDAMIKTSRDRLSDPNFKITPACEIDGCDDNGTHRLCGTHAGTHHGT